VDEARDMSGSHPLTPPGCDLRDFPHMQLDVVRLRDSAIAGGDPVAFRAAVILWCASWHQVPAASLPDDDVMLARLAGFGKDVRNWKRTRAKGALHGFILCSDGRLYHPVVAEKAIAAYGAKGAQRARTEDARAAKAALRAASTPPPPSLHPASTPPPPTVQAASTDGAGAVEGVFTVGQLIETIDDTHPVTDDKTRSKGEERERRGEENQENPPTPQGGLGLSGDVDPPTPRKSRALRAPPEVPALPPWLPIDAWNGFADARKAARKPMTDHAKKLAIRKLDELRQEGSDPRDVLEQSVLRGWQGLFAVEADRRSGPAAGRTTNRSWMNDLADGGADETPAFIEGQFEEIIR
jgi:hypothetical protein